MSIVISHVFMNGNSQAVRIPQEFRLDASRVQISRNDQGDLVIRALAADRGTALLEALRAFDDGLAEDFAQRLAQDRLEQAPPQEREALWSTCSTPVRSFSSSRTSPHRWRIA